MHKHVALFPVAAFVVALASSSSLHAAEPSMHEDATFAHRIGDVVVASSRALEKLGYVVERVDPELRSLSAHRAPERGIGAYSGVTFEKSVDVWFDARSDVTLTTLTVVPHIIADGRPADDDPTMRPDETATVRDIIDAVTKELAAFPNDTTTVVAAYPYETPWPEFVAWTQPVAVVVPAPRAGGVIHNPPCPPPQKSTTTTTTHSTPRPRPTKSK